ncbi:YhcN/YlaJ family sporulation lipoprotein [Peribacillus sp. NPDC097264]|uniref:YhcN/YlaJ family sporulation lipoprotein n=1 Tax=Peribacillus sp. NPDC097264 TaxID=3390616 RepID=UPI003D030F4F
MELLRKQIFSLAALLLMSGCSTDHASDDSKDQAKNGLTQVHNSTIQESDRRTGQETSKRLTNLAQSVPEVNDATAVVIGKYALVGIDIDADIERSQVGTVKYSVGETLKNDPHGAYAIVVADPDLNARIKEVAADIKNGEPVRGILNELADITSRVIPEVPGDTLTPTPAKVTDDQGNSPHNQDDRKQLEKEQNEQSNHHKD